MAGMFDGTGGDFSGAGDGASGTSGVSCLEM